MMDAADLLLRHFPGANITDTSVEFPELGNIPGGNSPKLPITFRGVAGRGHDPQTVKENGLPPTYSGKVGHDGEQQFFDGKALGLTDEHARRQTILAAGKDLNINPIYHPDRVTSRGIPFLPPGANRGLVACTFHLMIAARYALKRFLQENKFKTLRELQTFLKEKELKTLGELPSKANENPTPTEAYVYVISTPGLELIDIGTEFSFRENYPPSLVEYEASAPETIGPKHIAGYFGLQMSTSVNHDGEGHPYLNVTLGKLTYLKTCNSATKERIEWQLPHLTHELKEYKFLIAELDGQPLQEHSSPDVRYPPLEVQRYTFWQQHPTLEHFLQQYSLPDFYLPSHSDIKKLEPPRADQPIELKISEHDMLKKYRQLICSIVSQHQSRSHRPLRKEESEEIFEGLKAYMSLIDPGPKQSFLIHMLIPFSPLYDLPEIHKKLSARGYVNKSHSVTHQSSGQRYLLFSGFNEINKVRNLLRIKPKTPPQTQQMSEITPQHR